MRRVIVIYLTLFSLCVSAQEHLTIPKLTRKLKHQREDTTRVRLLASLSQQLASQDPEEGITRGNEGLALAERLNWEQGIIMACDALASNYGIKANHASALSCARRALDISRRIQYKPGIAASLRTIGKVNTARGSYVQATICFNEAQTIDEETGDKAGLAKDIQLTGGVYQSQSNYAKALDYQLRALKISEEIPDYSGVASIYGSIGMAHIGQGNFRAALTNYENALAMYRKINDKAGIALNLKNVGNAYISLKIYDSALAYYNLAINVYRELGDKSGIARNIGNMGNVYQERGDYARALKYLLDAAAINNELGEKYPLQNNLGSIGQIYLEIARDTSDRPVTDSLIPTRYGKADKTAALKRAIIFLDSTVRFDRELGNLNELQQFSRVLSEAYELAGDHKKAFDLYAESRKAHDSVFSLDNSMRFARLNEAWEAEQRQKQIEMQQLKLTARRHENLFFFVLLVIAVLVAANLYRRFRVTKRTRRELEEKNRIIEAEKDFANAMRARAEQSEKFKREFLTGMSHELRTPMNAISGMTDLLLEKSPNNEQRKYLEVISRSSEMLILLINDILDLSKIEAGKLTLEQIDFFTPQVLTAAKGNIQLKTEDMNTAVNFDFAEDIPQVLVGDPLRLRQLIEYITLSAAAISNAAKVILSIKPVNENDEKTRLHVSVVMPGTQLAATTLERMLRATGEPDDAEQHGRHDLEMAISRHLVSLFGSTLCAETTTRETRIWFDIELPMGSASRIVTQTSAVDTSVDSSLNGVRVLVVDDNDYNRMVASETLLSRASMHIDEAVNGREAIDKLIANDYDIILMDVQMPVMNGLDATRHIRSQLPAPKCNVPIIALTASLLREDIGLCAEAGMNTYLPKPFKANDLIRIMAQSVSASNGK